MFVLCGLVAFCFLAGISAGGSDACGDYKPFPNFQLSKYFGSWWQQGKTNNDTSMDCKEDIWKSAPSGNIKIVKNFLATTNLHMYKNVIKARTPDPSKPGYIETRNDGHYMILGTDYTSYSVTYYCEWGILEVATREKFPPASVIEKAEGFMKEHGIDTKINYHSLEKCDDPKIKTREVFFFINEFAEEESQKNMEPQSQPVVTENEDKTTTEASKTEKSPENKEPQSQPPITENEEAKFSEQTTPKKVVSIDVDITITVQ